MNFSISFFANVMFDPGNIWDGNHLSQSFLFENVNDMIARADEQMIRPFHSQCFAVGCVDRERLKWLSLLQLADFICNHQSRLIFSAVTDKIDNGDAIAVAAVSDRRSRALIKQFRRSEIAATVK